MRFAYISDTYPAPALLHRMYLPAIGTCPDMQIVLQKPRAFLLPQPTLDMVTAPQGSRCMSSQLQAYKGCQASPCKGSPAANRRHDMCVAANKQ